MIDIHSHILPGLDDGARTIDDALQMAEDAIADGITHVVGTPHASSDYKFDFARVQAACAELREVLGNRLTLSTGCDFHLSRENLERIKADPAPYCINQKDYLLVEFNEFSIPQAMDQTLHELQLAGLRPIITHPERNGILRTQPERLKKWVEMGCYAQVTAGSLGGVFGPRAKDDSFHWIAQGLVHIVSSDGHNTGRRPLKLKFAYELVAEQFGEEKARALLVENPRAAVEGLPLPHVPELDYTVQFARKKRFFFF